MGKAPLHRIAQNIQLPSIGLLNFVATVLAQMMHPVQDDLKRKLTDLFNIITLAFLFSTCTKKCSPAFKL